MIVRPPLGNESASATTARGLRYPSAGGKLSSMSFDVTRILNAIEGGDPSAAAELLPLVYDELRQLAAAKLSHEKPGQTLNATALVHEAYLRLVDVKQVQHWNSRGHLFAAAAEAMRRILIENARGKARDKHGGGWQRVDFEELDVTTSISPDQLPAAEVRAAEQNESRVYYRRAPVSHRTGRRCRLDNQ